VQLLHEPEASPERFRHTHILPGLAGRWNHGSQSQFRPSATIRISTRNIGWLRHFASCATSDRQRDVRFLLTSRRRRFEKANDEPLFNLVDLRVSRDEARESWNANHPCSNADLPADRVSRFPDTPPSLRHPAPRGCDRWGRPATASASRDEQKLRRCCGGEVATPVGRRAGADPTAHDACDEKRAERGQRCPDGDVSGGQLVRNRGRRHFRSCLRRRQGRASSSSSRPRARSPGSVTEAVARATRRDCPGEGEAWLRCPARPGPRSRGWPTRVACRERPAAASSTSPCRTARRPPGGPLALQNSRVTANTLSGTGSVQLQGGGIYLQDEPITLTNSAITQNVPDQCFGF
jgi:hypothetical protein